MDDDEQFESFIAEEMMEWRINLALLACSGIPDAALKACGEGGVSRLVEAAQKIRYRFAPDVGDDYDGDDYELICVCCAQPDFGPCADDCELAAALAPFQTPEAEEGGE